MVPSGYQIICRIVGVSPKAGGDYETKMIPRQSNDHHLSGTPLKSASTKETHIHSDTHPVLPCGQLGHHMAECPVSSPKAKAGDLGMVKPKEVILEEPGEVQGGHCRL